MTQITGGVVSVEDGKKAAEEFAPARKVRVELHFDVAEGTDAEAQLNGVAALADAKVREMLGGKAAKVQAALVEALAPKPGKTKADLAKEAGLTADETPVQPKKGPSRPAAKEKTVDKTKDEDVLDDGSAEVSDDLSDVLGEAPKEITDLEMNTAVGKKNADLKAPQLIRALIQKFTPEGKAPALSVIPQAKRAEFLGALAALEKE